MSQGEPDLTLLVERYIAGDQTAEAELIDAIERVAANLIQHRLPEPQHHHNREDLVSESVSDIVDAIPTLKETSWRAVCALAMTISLRRVFDFFRRQARSRLQQLSGEEFIPDSDDIEAQREVEAFVESIESKVERQVLALRLEGKHWSAIQLACQLSERALRNIRLQLQVRWRKWNRDS